ncbi:MAG: ribonuclease P protein component [Candidatus Azobacteroides pseudotrichonymphae]|jgi:ribonuclease P protein component|uniref:Ribonuclease P protein component n=1 Tax=Azobacteroides pseudotrichonymphae genomovar. CFP2 TaxID=511995 RepID=B6YQH6_AZOPC|nr:ribonuclease P protein component [Candidatus Azobacteroides pseudotrichonymphae]MDR0530368.1 ribonuclease P protein component [Bacteroidales bacterium OttesenSCG-928-I14]BAG83448.1 ribonuclease P protein component [Candidatus Azobacteroides pseudotrichonymphae genomovar. CFP2]GMO36194.1 MAG: ribonuclease P protein component [Candidatus Azobacteroides pseudotrichonymphae]
MYSSNFKRTFVKTERLSLQKEVNYLFEQGLSFNIYPLRIVYLEKQTKGKIPVSILISVSKKRLRHSFKRNRIKRLIRESYRLTKNRLWEYLFIKNKGLSLAFIYTGDELHSYAQIKTVMDKILDTLIEKML